MASKLDIPLHGSSVKIVSRCGDALSDILQSKFGCVATFDGVERGPGIAQQKKSTVVPEKRFATVLRSGVKVSVWKADLTDFCVDAVVNAANSGLQHCGGLALALSYAGGPQIQKESDDYIKKYGNLKTGDAIVSNAWSLPCKKIIHAVGPQLSKNASISEVTSAKPLLEKTITSILKRVKETRLQSVAIPAISSGLFNYPLQDCATTIVTTINHTYEYFKQGHFPQEIMLVNHDEPTVKEMERACRQILGPSAPISYSQAVTSQNRGNGKTSTTSVQLGSVNLTLKWGNIEEQHTDVIVNTTTFDGNLNSGAISKALLLKAGHEMQQEMYRAFRRGLVVITKPYKLLCKEVYHTFWTGNERDKAQKILWDSVSECLRLAASKQHNSISFPAIGTGGLGFNKKDVAQVMSDAVANFAQKFPKKMDVYFVIFHYDNETFKAFEEKMRYLQQKAPDPGFTHALEPREDSHGSRATTPQISLIGQSDEATREAERWLNRLLFEFAGTIRVCNNFILHFGEEEHLQLSRLIKRGVSIEEVFVRNHAGIIIKGDSKEDVVVAGLQVEAMLCNIQKEFVKEEECAMLLLSTKNVSSERRTVHHSSQEFSDRYSSFSGLWIVKVDKVENPALKMLFDLKKQQLGCSSSQRMFQRIPAQFCQMVSHVGFHAEYAPPDDPAYGEGIYFAGTVKKAMEVWKELDEEYLYFVEAEVLTGNSTHGKPGLILPPSVGTDPQILYDSVSGGRDVSVIFSGYQALPMYIITCKVSSTSA